MKDMNHKLTDLLDRLGPPRDAFDLADTLIGEILENGGRFDLPSRACDPNPGPDDHAGRIKTVVEIELYGVVAHGHNVEQACVNWLQAARGQVEQADADPS